MIYRTINALRTWWLIVAVSLDPDRRLRIQQLTFINTLHAQLEAKCLEAEHEMNSVLEQNIRMYVRPMYKVNRLMLNPKNFPAITQLIRTTLIDVEAELERFEKWKYEKAHQYLKMAEEAKRQREFKQ